MNTKKFYVTPATEAVEIKASTILAGSGVDLGGSGSIPDVPGIDDPDEE